MAAALAAITGYAQPHWVTYRSFNKELQRTAQFAAMGISNRCLFATIATDVDRFKANFRTPDTRLFKIQLQ